MKTILVAGGVSLLIALFGTPLAIKVFSRRGYGQLIREEGPAAHLGKAGTPTAGGVVFLFVGLALFVATDRKAAGALVIVALLLGGALGFADDFAAIRGNRNLGLKARQKIVAQLLIGALLGYLAYRWNLTRQLVPFDGWRDLGAWAVPVGAVAFAAGSNAFNLTDGSDGLAGGAGAITFGSLALIAILQQRPAAGLMAAALAGCLIGFLFYNAFPARIFMGDTGSLALGTALVAAAIGTGFLWYLPLLALVFVIETISVIAQVASFKLTGKRIIKMSPLHNHFIVSGWRETRIAATFWAASAAAAALSLLISHPGRLS